MNEKDTKPIFYDGSNNYAYINLFPEIIGKLHITPNDRFTEEVTSDGKGIILRRKDMEERSGDGGEEIAPWLFGYKIFRTDEPHELIFTDEFNKASSSAYIYTEIFGFSTFFKYILRCVENHFWELGRHDLLKDDKTIGEIAGILYELHKAGLLKNAQKNVTEEDNKRTRERIDRELEKVYGHGNEGANMK